MDIRVLFQQVLLLVLMVIPGVLLKKTKLVGDQFGVGLSNLVLYVATPAMILLSFMREFDGAVVKRAAIVAVFCFLFHIFFFFVAMLLYRRAAPDIAKVLRFTTVFTNAGYMGIPLVQAVLGDVATIFATFYVIFFNIFIWTIGCYIYTRDRSYISLKKAFLNPATISVSIGWVLSIGTPSSVSVIFRTCSPFCA